MQQVTVNTTPAVNSVNENRQQQFDPIGKLLEAMRVNQLKNAESQRKIAESNSQFLQHYFRGGEKE